MINSKKSQLFILSAVVMILLLIYIYSQETENSYIVKNGQLSLIDNVIHETCQIGYLSNGSYIDQRYSNFTGEVSTYCSSFGYSCSLLITNNTQIPPSGNYSLLNYTHYNYSIDYEYRTLSISKNFTC